MTAARHRPTMDPEIIRTRMIHAARKRLTLSVKGAADACGMSNHWNWYAKERGDAFTMEQIGRFCETVGAPTLFPFYDWDHALDLDERLGWSSDNLPR